MLFSMLISYDTRFSLLFVYMSVSKVMRKKDNSAYMRKNDRVLF